MSPPQPQIPECCPHNSAPQAAAGPSATPTLRAPLPTAPSNISTARPILPLSATAAATPHNPHTVWPTPSTATACLLQTLRIAPQTPSPISPLTIRPTLCD